MTDTFDRMVHQVDVSYGDRNPSPATQAYLQTCATLELARQQREANTLAALGNIVWDRIELQLTRIADALNPPKHAVHHMADDGLGAYRQSATPAELHDCTQDLLAPPLCDECPDRETCVHTAQSDNESKGPDWDASPPAWDCGHIPTDGNEPMTQNTDSRDSAELPSRQ